MSDTDRRGRLIAVTLDDSSIGRAPPDIEHERAVAIYDLVEENSFALKDHPGPYRLVLSHAEKRLVFDIRSESGEPLMTHVLSLTPFRKVVKDTGAAIIGQTPDLAPAVFLAPRDFTRPSRRERGARPAVPW